MRRVARTIPALLFVLCLSGCPNLSDSLSPGSGKQTYPSIWINASWGGGRTGTPLESKAVTPNTIIGKYCPATSMVPLNHPPAYALRTVSEGLYVDSNCTALVNEMAACSTAGSGGTGTTLSICATDPRKTSANNLRIIQVPALTRGNAWFGATGLNVDVNFFYCATGSHMNLGEVSGKDPTDCVVD